MHGPKLQCRDVRFTPESGHSPRRRLCPLSAKSGRSAPLTFIEKASRLYEQERRAVSASSPLEMYVRRWLRRARSGVIVKTGNRPDVRAPARVPRFTLPMAAFML